MSCIFLQWKLTNKFIMLIDPFRKTEINPSNIMNCVLDGVLFWKNIMEWLDNPITLWDVGEKSYSGLNNRIAKGKEDGVSLYLISVEQLRLLVGRKAPEYADSKWAIRGEFIYQHISYRMDVTDTLIEQNYRCQADGQYDIHRPVLCISLGELYQGYFYKLIAAVSYPERFK